jgi:hypothetical protein
MRLSPFDTSATNWPIVPDQMIEDERGAFDEIIGRENRSTGRKPAPTPLCPPHILRDMTWARTQATAMGDQKLTS